MLEWSLHLWLSEIRVDETIRDDLECRGRVLEGGCGEEKSVPDDLMMFIGRSMKYLRKESQSERLNLMDWTRSVCIM